MQIRRSRATQGGIQGRHTVRAPFSLWRLWAPFFDGTVLSTARLSRIRVFLCRCRGRHCL